MINWCLAISPTVYISSRFLKTLSPDGPFASDSFFRPKTISKVAIIKTKSATITFSLLLLSFSALRNLPFDAFSLK